MRNPELVQYLIEKFSNLDPNTGCMICNRKPKSTGYCWIPVEVLGGRITAHRAMYRAAHGPLGDGEQVRHKCDNRACMNPDHLEAGTHKQNMNDMKIRGRSNKGKPLLKNRGANNPGAKLDESKVIAIRARADAGEAIASLATEFGLTTRHTWAVATRRAWAHVVDHHVS